MKSPRADKPLSVLIVDDHPLFREGLVHALGTEDGFRIVGEAADGQTALALWEAHRPDVTLVDISMPGLDGISLVRHVRSAHPRARLLMLSSSEEQEDVLAALDAGAVGYVTKGVRYTELKAAIREVHAGGRPLGEAIATRLAARQPDAPLTPRETAVLRMLSEGFGHLEIAERLAISERTARAHVAAVREKLHAANAAQAVAEAFARGILERRR
ncbi:MAG: DNA-binding response regulator [Planctomycetia bacterium]|nr:DNA-binding response regulator [Planctomycetia bacterium]